MLRSWLAVMFLGGCIASGGEEGEPKPQEGEGCVDAGVCGSGLECVEGACVASFGPAPARGGGGAAPAGPASSVVRSACQRFASLPCYEDSAAECEQEGAEAEARAEAEGCGVEFEAVTRCVAGAQLACDEDGDLDFRSLEPCLTQLQAAEGCGGGGCEGSASCGSGGGDACGTSLTQQCGEGPAESAAADCVREGERWRCTCTRGQREGRVFLSSAESCCDVNDTLEEACGLVEGGAEPGTEGSGRTVQVPDAG